MSEPVYLGFDLSTQQLKCLAITQDLKVVNQAKFDFDADSRGFGIHKGVLTNPDEGEVFAPVALWLQALDAVLEKMKQDGLSLERVKGISAAGMQHGCVFWNYKAKTLLANLDARKSLEEQLAEALAHPDSPNWQDASTQTQCDAFDQILGSAEELARLTGSKAHHRFTGPQIMRFKAKYPKHYQETARITLVSSWMATVLLGDFAPFDIADVCGMNLRTIRTGEWHETLLGLVAGEDGVADLKNKLGDVPEDGGATLGVISKYFVERHGFNPECKIVTSTGDNPSTMLALPLRQNDAIVSLGTSSTFLMATSEYLPDPSYHFLNSPTTAGLYMFMLCYKNGGLAREQVRNTINEKIGLIDRSSWEHFDQSLLSTSALGQNSADDSMKLGIYFPLREIVPNLPKGRWNFEYDANLNQLTQVHATPNPPQDDARIIVESQFLSMRLRASKLVQSPDGDLPPQPRRIYLVGGGSRNAAIAKVCGQVLGGSEGIYKLDVGENACALGSAHKAVWALERTSGEKFEDFISSRWSEDQFVQRLCDGYQKGVFEKYGEALKGFERMEQDLLLQHGL